MSGKFQRVWREGLALLLLVASTAALADCPFEPVAVLPLLPGKRPVIEATINGQPVHLVVDTGAQISSVVPETAADLGLPPDPARRTVNTSIGGQRISRNVVIGRLALGAVGVGDLSVSVEALDGKDRTLAGIVGADVLGNFDLGLDMPDRALTLYRKQECVPATPPWTGPYQMVAGRVDAHRFLFPVTLNGHTVSGVFDTGSLGETVSLASAKSIGIGDGELGDDPVVQGTSAGEAAYTIHRHRFDTFGIGREVFRGVPLDVADFHQPDTDILIGVDYMHWRRFFLSNSSGVLFIQREPADRIRAELKLRQGQAGGE